MEILPADTALPMPYIRRLDPIHEVTRYVARPGLRALPSGAFTLTAFVGLQAWALTILLWAVWWPAPISTRDYAFCIGVTCVFAVAVVIVAWLLLRRHPGFLLAVVRAPFIRLTVTDRRIVWSLPWMKAPLMQIGRDRILGGIQGETNRRGHGSAAVLLIPGDPSADVDGAIHFDRLPHVARFVSALG